MSSRTLVLLDGQRVAPSNQDGTVNVDALPQMLMSRVDVVTGGASAVYGSDAVAGVVNFILDKKFDRLQIRHQCRHLEIWRCRGREDRPCLGHRSVRRPGPL